MKPPTQEETSTSTTLVRRVRPSGYTLLFDWVPTLRYYQDRISPILRLEEKGLIKSFLVQPERLGVRLDGTELQLRPSGMLLMTASELTDPLCVGIISDILATFQPKAFRQLHVMNQYVIPIHKSYDAARRDGLSAIKEADLQSIGGTDFAYMVTGESPNIHWMVEAGIISKDEIRQRVLRTVGAFEGGPSSEMLLNNVESSEVAFFCDSQWIVKNLAPTGGPRDWVLEVFADIDRLASKVMPQVLQGIVRESDEGSQR